MKREVFDEQVKRLREVNEVIAKLEPNIQAPAFSILLPYVTRREAVNPPNSTNGAGTGEESDTVDFETFLAKHTTADAAPAENVLLITAYLYSRFGSEPFSTIEIRRTADDAGLTVPERIDMTLKSTKRDGKTLYAAVPGGYKPTVFGETYLKSTYQVRKGREKRAEAVSQE
jgi:hypothetical protein